jgi:hypothetical protein
MLKRGFICLYGKKQALRAHVWAENGPKTAETWVRRQKLAQTGRKAEKLFTHPGWPKMPLSLI